VPAWSSIYFSSNSSQHVLYGIGVADPRGRSEGQIRVTDTRTRLPTLFNGRDSTTVRMVKMVHIVHAISITIIDRGYPGHHIQD